MGTVLTFTLYYTVQNFNMQEEWFNTNKSVTVTNTATVMNSPKINSFVTN